jgi:hypothetical protein
MRNLTLLCCFALAFFYADAQKIFTTGGDRSKLPAFAAGTRLITFNQNTVSDAIGGSEGIARSKELHYDRSYAKHYVSFLLPVPQQVSLRATTFLLDNSWSLAPQNNKAFTPAITSLKEGLQERKILLRNNNTPASHVIKLVVKDGAVQVGNTTDTNHAALEKQAYHLTLTPTTITITANDPQGLYYGVQTFLQLIKSQAGKVWLPEGEIIDWPDLDVRMIYWDDAHHLEKMDALKRIIRQCAYYKINAFSIKLEGHFQFKSAPAIVEPYALSPGEYQQLTDYAKEHYVELVPYLDAPAHVSFILKHPEYANLRLFPNNNYEFSVTNPGTEKLLKGMFADLLNANKGAHYVLLSTDEAYYTGKGGDEIEAAKAWGGNGQLLAQFIKRIADELHKQGRRVLFWGEYPLTANDIDSLPSYLVNGEYSNEVAARFKRHGIRQFIYTATQGEEPVFPNYYTSRTKSTVMEDGERSPDRVPAMLKEITSAVNEKLSDFMGVIIAGWSDAGLHPETFWLGYAIGASAGWNRQQVTADELTSHFYKSFYGPQAYEMDSIYRLLSSQAEFFDKSWDWIDSKWRKPILGNSYGIFDTPRAAKDQTLLLLPVPNENDLSLKYDWDTANNQRITMAEQFLKENNVLQRLLTINSKRIKYQHYNLEVVKSKADLCRQNLEMLLALKDINDYLKAAATYASSDAAKAVNNLDSALSVAADVKKQRDAMFASVEKVWFKDWQPLVPVANDRRFLHELDDIKDHEPGRTIDLSYLIYRQIHYPLDKWTTAVTSSRNAYAAKHNLQLRREVLQWAAYK